MGECSKYGGAPWVVECRRRTNCGAEKNEVNDPIQSLSRRTRRPVGAEVVGTASIAWKATTVRTRRRRAELLAAIRTGDPQIANEALLELTYDDPDGDWVEPILLEHLAPEHDLPLRRLATTCLGHLARIHGKITRTTVVPALHALLSDPDLGGTAEDALQDIDIFAPVSPETHP